GGRKKQDGFWRLSQTRRLSKMPEEPRKAARLLPWRLDGDPMMPRILDATGGSIATVHNVSVADLILRAPALVGAARDAIPQMEMLWDCAGDCVDENMAAVA